LLISAQIVETVAGNCEHLLSCLQQLSLMIRALHLSAEV